MQNDIKFVGFDNAGIFFERLCADSMLFSPAPSFDELHISRVKPENAKEIKLERYRAIEAVKGMAFKISEKVSEYHAGARQKITLLGIKNCDVMGIGIEDKVFAEGEIADPFYKANRDNITIISSDCTDARDTCFCTLAKYKPYPESGFDLNLSPAEKGFIVEIGSVKGKKLVEDNKELFSEPGSDALARQRQDRKKMLELLDKKNAGFKLKLELCEIHKRNLENGIWRELTKDCVECSACNFACPTCTCFLLLDEDRDARFKVWDACLKAGYAKVAGGANPRGKLYQRLQNRYQCKFDYSFDRLGVYACVGCGRCISACAGNIDMRKIFVELEKQVPLTAKLE
jgi:sulfhydrogenase subunit beta (sulfur reductase)